MTSLTDGMERDGLVARLRSATDRRVIGVELTQKGAALFEQAASANTAWVNELFTEMSLEQLILLRELIGDLKNSASRAGMDGLARGRSGRQITPAFLCQCRYRIEPSAPPCRTLLTKTLLSSDN